MKSILLTLINSKKSFENIAQEYADVLHRKSLILFGIYGLIPALLKFNSGESQSEFLTNLIGVGMGVALFVLFWVLISLSIYKIGNWLGGQATFIDIEAIIAHALIPLGIGLLLIFLLKSPYFLEDSWNSINFRNRVFWLSATSCK